MFEFGKGVATLVLAFQGSVHKYKGGQRKLAVPRREHNRSLHDIYTQVRAPDTAFPIAKLTIYQIAHSFSLQSTMSIDMFEKPLLDNSSLGISKPVARLPGNKGPSTCTMTILARWRNPGF